MKPPPNEEALFQAAAPLPTADRTAFLDQECAGDPSLRARLDALLAAHDTPDTLPSPDALVSPTTLAQALPQVPTADDAVGLTIGRYKLLERLGEGGCGVVYVAEQSEPVRRRVALKLIKPGMDSKAVIARFEAERQALALMDHPNIAKVLDGGTTDSGRPFFVMELVRGIRITEYCDQEKLPVRDRLDLFIKVCQAIQHAHQKGIIHRDIKPSNILVTLHDGVPVPKVIDFGIAKAVEGRLADATVYTQLHQFIGTPAYMSPEQAEMSGLDIDTRSDIYSLGVLLYELLTGVTPFDAKELVSQGLDAMRRTIREQEPVRPSTRLTQLQATRAGTPHALRHSRFATDLDWIVMKCLEKDRGRRYETANGLATDLKRHLDNEPVVARPPSAAYRFQKAWRRNRVAITAGLVVAMALLAGIGVSTSQAIRAIRAERAEQLQANRALEDRDRAIRAQQEALDQAAIAREAVAISRRNAYVAEMNVAYQALAHNNLGRARDLLHRQRPKEREEDLRGFEWRHLWHLCQDEARQTLTVGCAWEAIRYSPDGQLIACGTSPDGRLGTCGPSEIKILDARSHQVIRTLDGSADSLSFAPDGRFLAAGSQTGVALWETSKWGCVRRLEGAISPVAFSPDGRWLIAGVEGGHRVWDTRTWMPIGDCPGAPPLRWHGRSSVAFSPDGEFVATIAGDRYAAGDHLRIWRLPRFERFPDLHVPSGEPSSTVFTADGFLLSACWDGKIRLWDYRAGRLLATLGGHTGWITTLARSADGRTFASASVDRTIVVWDAQTFEIKTRFRGHTGEIWAMDIAPDGMEVLSGAVDRTSKVWRIDAQREDQLPGGAWRVVGFSDVGASIVAVRTNALCIWSPQKRMLRELPFTNSVPHLWIAHYGQPCAVTANPPQLVRGRIDGAVEVRPLTTGAIAAQWPSHTAAISAVSISPNETHLATASAEGEVKVWEIASRRELARSVVVAGAQPYCMTFSPDGTKLAFAGKSPSLEVWDWRDGRKVALTGGDFDMVSIAFSPDGRSIAATTQAMNAALVWDLASTRLLARLQGHVQGLWSLAFSPDGRTLATASGDRTIKLWNVATWQELASLPNDQRQATLHFSQNGRMLVVGSMSDSNHGTQILLSPSFEEIDAAEPQPSRVGPASPSTKPSKPESKP